MLKDQYFNAYAFSGANPTIVSYNATSSLVRFVGKFFFFYFEKRLWLTATLALQ
jgi:hypothetical protein